MRKKLVGILLSACIALGGFMTDGAVACAHDHGDASEYCELALVERFDKIGQKCEEINKMLENHTIGIRYEDGGTDPENPTSQTKYWVSGAVAETFWSVQDSVWKEDGSGRADQWETKHYLWEVDTDGDSNWNDEGMLTSVKRSELLAVVNDMEAAVQPIWDVIHPSKPKKTKSHNSDTEEAAETAAEKAERLKAEEERKALEEARRESIRLEKEAAEKGFVNGAQMQDAEAKGKSADEYYNNAVVDTPGIENPVPVAQGGKLVVDGKTTSMTATIEKVSSIYVDSIRAARQGTLLNVVKVNYPAAEAVITFYMPGVQAGDVIMAVQYEGGLWTDVEVTEVRADHVTLSLKENGVVAFLK